MSNQLAIAQQRLFLIQELDASCNKIGNFLWLYPHIFANLGLIGKDNKSEITRKFTYSLTSFLLSYGQVDKLGLLTCDTLNIEYQITIFTISAGIDLRVHKVSIFFNMYNEHFIHQQEGRIISSIFYQCSTNLN